MWLNGELRILALPTMLHSAMFHKIMLHKRTLRLTLPAILALLLLVGCSSAPEKEQTEREIYSEAKKNLTRGNFTTAQTKLEELETRFPFGRFSEQAQLDMMYAQMRGLDYPSATTTASRFLRQNPGNAHADYALYIRGLANYRMQSGALERRSPTNPALRDLSSLREAYGDFAALIARYPESEFSPDARARMLYLRNQLATQETANAWYYVRRGACVAAIKRAQYVLENFPSAPAIPDALVIAGECWRRLGEIQIADHFLVLLKNNFPQHPRLMPDGTLDVPEGRNDEARHWLRLVSFGLLD